MKTTLLEALTLLALLIVGTIIWAMAIALLVGKWTLLFAEFGVSNPTQDRYASRLALIHWPLRECSHLSGRGLGGAPLRRGRCAICLNGTGAKMAQGPESRNHQSRTSASELLHAVETTLLFAEFESGANGVATCAGSRKAYRKITATRSRPETQAGPALTPFGQHNTPVAAMARTSPVLPVAAGDAQSAVNFENV